MNEENPFQTDPLKQKIESPTNQFNSPSNLNNPTNDLSGPQFGFPPIEEAGKTRGWLNRYGSSVILPIIALLILASGIYLYATQKSEKAPSISESIPPTEQQNQANISGNLDIENQGETINPIAENATPGNVEQIVPASRIEGNNIIEKAVKGDSVTRLARRAVKDYLEENNQDLNNEQKVYAEDYLKDQIGSKKLKVDDELSFSEDLIKAAIDGALKLTPGQLKNLEKYSQSVVSW